MTRICNLPTLIKGQANKALSQNNVNGFINIIIKKSKDIDEAESNLESLLEASNLSEDKIKSIKDKFGKLKNQEVQIEENKDFLMRINKNEFYSKSIQDLYINKPLAFKHLEKDFKVNVLKSIFLNKETKEIIFSSDKANHYLLNFQNSLFKDIIKFLKNNDLWTYRTTNVKLNQKNSKFYIEALDIAADFIKSDFVQEKLTSSVNNEYIEFYNNVVTLAYFDELINDYFHDIIKIEGIYENLILNDESGNPLKYKIEIISKDMSTFGFEDSRRYAAEEMQTNLFKLISESIPYVDKDFKENESEYLTSNHIQLAMVVLDQLFLNANYDGEYFDLTQNPIETFKKVYERYPNTILGNDVLRSVFYYLFGPISSENPKINENFEFGYYSILNRMKSQNLNPVYSLFDLFAFETSKAKASEMFLFGKNTQNLHLKGLTYKEEIKEKLRKNVISVRNRDSNSTFIFKIDNKTYDLSNSESLKDFLNQRIKNKLSLVSGENENKQISILKYLSNLLDFPITRIVKYDEQKFGYFDQNTQNLLFSLITELTQEVITNEDDYILPNDFLKLVDHANSWEGDAKMQTYDSSKNTIPLAQLPSPIYKDNYFIKHYKDLYSKNKSSNILVDKRHRVFSNNNNENYNGSTAIKIDAKIGDVVKSAQTFTPKENLYVDFKEGFLNQIKNGLIYIQPVAYSDKGTIYYKCFNLKGAENNSERLMNQNNDDLLNIYFQFQNNYYTELKENLLNTWNKVFPDQNFTDLKQLDSYLKSLEPEVILNAINKALDENPGLEIVKERDYSVYKDKSGSYYALNKTLWYNITISTSKELFYKDFEQHFQTFKTVFKEFQFTEQDFNIKDYLKDKSLNLGKLGVTTEDALLKRYLIFKNMFTEQYLNLTLSSPFVHASKKGKDWNRIEDFNPAAAVDFNNSYYDRLRSEETSRLTAFGKRMNSYTAKQTPYITNNNNGIINTIKCAIVADPRAIVFNFDGGLTDDLESTNGSIFVPGFIARLMSNSLPGAGQEGVQKNFTVHIGKGYSSQIKDAQFLISNQVIRDSFGNTIDFKKVLRKMCIGQKISKNFEINKSFGINKQLCFLENGKYFKITNLSIKDNILTRQLQEVTEAGVEINGAISSNTIKINSIYDIWNGLGAEYSVNLINGRYEFGEDSMEYLAELMGLNKELQEDIIHMLAFESSVKCGAVNVNSDKTITENVDNDNIKLHSFNLSLSLSGIQNDKNESVDNNEIKEITQLIAALAQGNSIEESHSIYSDIGTVIKSAIKKLSSSEKNLESIKNTINTLFKDGLKNLEKISLAHAILNIYETDGKTVPFSENNIYPKFLSVLIQQLNNTAIKRKSSGLHGIMTPSEGIIELLEDKNGNVYTLSTIYELALTNSKYTNLSNENRIKQYIQDNFQDEPITIDNISSIDLEDTIKIHKLDAQGNFIFNDLTNDFEYENLKLDTPQKLKFAYDLINSGKTVFKVYSARKNLRPIRYSWTQEGKHKNLWTNYFILENFKDNKSIDSLTLSKSAQVVMLLLKNRYSFKDEFYLNQNDLNLFYEEVKQHYSTQLNLRLNEIISKFSDYIVKVENIQYKEAEIMMPQMHKSLLGIDAQSMYQIEQEGVKFFEKQLNQNIDFIEDSLITVTTTTHKFGFVSKITDEFKDVTAKDFKTKKDENGDIYVINKEGEKLFYLGNNKIYEKNGKYYILAKQDEESSRILLRSLSNAIHLNVNENIDSGTTDKTILKSLFEYLPNNLLKYNKQVKRILAKEHIYQADLVDMNNIFNSNFSKYVSSLAKKKYEAFKVLQKLISARIPGQSRQSFMSCRNVGYIGSNLNNVYCNKFMMWIQGADYDIDVANIMNFDLKLDGTLATYNVFEDISDYDSLDLPHPNSNLIVSFKSEQTKEVLEIYKTNETLNNKYTSLILEIIDNQELNQFDKVKSVIKILKQYNKEFKGNNKKIPLLFEKDNDFLETLNLYNSQTKSSRVVRNLILKKILKSSDDISNIQSSFRSVDVVTDYIKKPAAKYIKENNMNLKDGISAYIVQQINNDGKKTVGIYANAIKAYTTLLDYYNNNKINFGQKNVTLSFSDGSSQTYSCHGLMGTSNFIAHKDGIDYDPCDMLSAMLSLAVDNAKELMLSILNAGEEFAGCYAYLISLGVPVEQIIKFFTQDEVKKITENSKGYIFSGKETPSIKILISREINSITSEFNKLNELSSKVTDPEQILIYEQTKKNLRDKLNIYNNLKTIYNSAQELRQFTSILKINQGVKNNSVEIIKFKQNFIRPFKEFFKMNKENLTDTELIKKAIDLNILVGTFNPKQNKYTNLKYGKISLNQFCTNLEYRKTICKIYDQIKDTFNIYDAIAKSDIYLNLLEKLADIDSSASKVSFKYKMVSQVHDIIAKQMGFLPKSAFNQYGLKNLKDTDYKNLENLANDIVISAWAKNNINLNINQASVYNMIGKSAFNKLINLKTAKGIQDFINLMQTVIIPNFLKHSEEFSENEFVKHLILHYDKYKKEHYYKLDINLSKVKSISQQIKKNNIMDGFNTLTKKQCPILNIDGTSIGTWGELLFIYNTLATKNTFGPNKMTAIFENYITTNPHSGIANLHRQYFEFDQNINNIENYVDSILFTLFQDNGKVKLPKVIVSNQTEETTEENNETETSSNQYRILMNDTKSFYNLLEDSSIEENKEKQKYVNQLLDYIKNDVLTVYLKC